MYMSIVHHILFYLSQLYLIPLKQSAQFSLIGWNIFNVSNLFWKKRHFYWCHPQLFLNTSHLLSMNLSKATFGESSSSSFSVLFSEPLEPLKANISFGTNGVNLSERCSFLSLIKSFNSVNGSKILSFDIV